MQDGINDNQAYRFNTNGKGAINMYYSESNEAKPILEEWYLNNIANNQNYAAKVAEDNYFCEEAKVVAIEGHLGGNSSLFSNYSPNFMCEKNGKDGNGKGFVSSSIGLITYDEVLYAGGYYGSNNSNYYLYNPLINIWTMSPSGYGSDNILYNWYIHANGYLGIDFVDDTRSLRPVINIKSDVTATGLGTEESPYVIK